MSIVSESLHWSSLAANELQTVYTQISEPILIQYVSFGSSDNFYREYTLHIQGDSLDLFSTLPSGATYDYRLIRLRICNLYHRERSLCRPSLQPNDSLSNLANEADIACRLTNSEYSTLNNSKRLETICKTGCNCLIHLFLLASGPSDSVN